jgi:hypothetical protein
MTAKGAGLRQRAMARFRVAQRALTFSFLASVLVAFRSISVAGAVNIVILLADDFGWGDPSPPLGVGVAQMPELNAMAVAPGAAHFPRSYIGGSVCSPSRASILTGRSCSRDCVISVETMALPLQLQGNTLGDAARAASLSTFFSGRFGHARKGLVASL